MDEAWKAGLEDVVAARSGVCTIDGAAGRLYYRGYEIGELAGAVPFEDVTVPAVVRGAADARRGANLPGPSGRGARAAGAGRRSAPHAAA